MWDKPVHAHSHWHDWLCESEFENNLLLKLWSWIIQYQHWNCEKHFINLRTAFFNYYHENRWKMKNYLHNKTTACGISLRKEKWYVKGVPSKTAQEPEFALLWKMSTQHGLMAEGTMAFHLLWRSPIKVLIKLNVYVNRHFEKQRSPLRILIKNHIR